MSETVAMIVYFMMSKAMGEQAGAAARAIVWFSRTHA